MMEEFEAATEAGEPSDGVAEQSQLDKVANLFGATVEDEQVGNEEVEDAGDTSEDDVAQADEETEEDDEPTFTIKVDGKELSIKQSEALADASKWRASSGRFDEAATIRKTADEEIKVYQGERDKLNTVLSHYVQQMNTLFTEKQPDWDQLRQNDPVQFLVQKDLWLQKQADFQQAQHAQQILAQQQEQESKLVHARTLQEQQAKVLELFPEFKDPAIATTAVKQIEDYLESEGFSQIERASLADARMLKVVYMAAKYKDLVESTPTGKKQKPVVGKTLNPGTSKGSPNKTAKAKQAQADFKKNPTIDNLAQFFLKP